MLDQILTISQASAHLQITKTTLYAWIKAGKLHAFRVKQNGSLRIRLADILEPYSGKSESHSQRGKLAPRPVKKAA